MNKYEKYVSDQARIESIRSKVVMYMNKWKVSEPQMARYCQIHLHTLRSFLQKRTNKYQERIISSMEFYFSGINNGV